MQIYYNIKYNIAPNFLQLYWTLILQIITEQRLQKIF